MKSTISLFKKFFQAFGENIKQMGVWKYILYVLLTGLISVAAGGLVYLIYMLFQWGYPALGVLLILLAVGGLIVVPVLSWRKNEKGKIAKK